MSAATMGPPAAPRAHAPLPALGARDRRRRVVSRVMLTLTGVAAALTVVPLLLIFFHLMRAGLGSLNPDFFTHVPAPVGETGGGVGNGVLGTFILVVLAGLMGLPVAIGAGIYLAEAEGGRLPNAIRFVTDVMNGIPSIVIGIFVWAWVVVSTGGFSAMAGGVALAIMLLPMVTRTTEEMVRLVPRELKEGALALGFTRWRTTLGVVLPAARSGILTGVLVALARIAGETAPLLFTAFGNPFWSAKLNEPIAALPVQIFQYAISPYEEQHAQAWAASLLLIALVLAMSLTARFLIRSPYRSR
ncbi:phosphate ABC transporter permease PstA [Longimicrobium sp.]|uniref:phosphate ABC transporter permease PstA n=1 Tax=Longimicrobium sp. TaxID=2029185 RepID=UPI002E36FF85|nr:phosphate ABC transporter permease PstA [Longimicrobium sp.]HEX6037453.1 phosphate ABC transporter permease PstA [Longimicrobium sp.]